VGTKWIVATHHKVGTVLMKEIFTQIAREFGYEFHDYSQLPDPEAASKADIIFDHSSKFSGLNLTAFENLKGIHLLRDPRMVIVSAAFYHQHARETWLLTPRQSLDGMSYQQKINSLPNDEARFEFEMRNSASGTIRDMHSFMAVPRPWCRTIKLETLMTDIELVTYKGLFEFLGFSNSDVNKCVAIAHRNSVFHPEFKSRHVRSRRADDWRSYFTPRLETLFRESFGDLPEYLGYET
jgi:hypothetical protein